MSLKRAFTHFLCAFMIFFIVVGPMIFTRYKVKYTDIYETQKKKDGWKGVISFSDYPRTDIRTGLKYSWIKSKIKQFEKENPGVYIDFREMDPKSGGVHLKAAVKTGAPPDIAPVGSDFYYIKGGYLERLDGEIDRADLTDYVENALNAVAYNGGIYGLPWMMTGHTMLINTNIFSDKGVSLPVDGEWTYEQFVEALKLISFDMKGKPEKEIYGFNCFIEPGYYNVFGILMSDGAQIIDSSGGFVFNGKDGLSGLKKLYDLKHIHKVTHPRFGEMTEGEAWSSFVQGKVAVYIGSSSSVQILRNLQNDGRINFTAVSFPKGSADVPLTINNSVSAYGVFKQKDELKRQKCVEFIKFITQEDKQEELKNFGYFPVRKSGKYLYENDKEMYTIQQDISFAEPIPKVENWDEIDLVLQSRIKAAINGEITPEEALEEAGSQIRKHLK